MGTPPRVAIAKLSFADGVPERSAGTRTNEEPLTTDHTPLTTHHSPLATPNPEVVTHLSIPTASPSAVANSTTHPLTNSPLTNSQTDCTPLSAPALPPGRCRERSSDPCRRRALDRAAASWLPPAWPRS